MLIYGFDAMLHMLSGELVRKCHTLAKVHLASTVVLKNAFYGAPYLIKTSWTEDNPGRRFLGCGKLLMDF